MDDTVSGARIASEKELPRPSPDPQSLPPQQQPPKRRGVLKWLVALALAVAAVLAFQYYEDIAPTSDEGKPAGAGKPAGPPPQTVRAAPIVRGDIPLYINALGTVTPLATVTVRTQIAGQLQQIGFVEGQMVKAGDFLAQIDARPYQATLAQDQGQLAKDSALYAQAEADLARYQTLNRQDSISHQQVEDQTFLVAQYKAAMATDQAQIDAAALNIAYCRIVAPVGGRVGLRQVDQGNYVQSSDANGIVVITQIEPITVVFSTPEDNLPQIMARMKTNATLPVVVFDRANVKQLATGSFTTTDNQIDPTTGTVKIRATFPNPDDALFPQQFVNVRLLVDTIASAVVAPSAGIQQGAPGAFAYVVKDDDTVTVRNVKIGASEGGRTQILSGLELGDKIVIDGADRLREGAKVTLSTVDAGGAATPATDQPPARERRRRNGQGKGQGQGDGQAKDPGQGADPDAPKPKPKTDGAQSQ
jgi:multidrug efflux system membrane fusion protein